MNVFGCLIWLSLEKSSQEKVSFSKRFPWAWEQNESPCRIEASSCFSPISSGERDGDSFHFFLSLIDVVGAIDLFIQTFSLYMSLSSVYHFSIILEKKEAKEAWWEF